MILGDNMELNKAPDIYNCILVGTRSNFHIYKRNKDIIIPIYKNKT